MERSVIEVLDSWDTTLTATEQVEARAIPDAEAGPNNLAERHPRIGMKLSELSLGTAGTAEMEIDQTGLNLVEYFEGLLLDAYWDPYGRVWTIGYGETYNVHQGEVWTQAQAQADLVNRMNADYEPSVRDLGVPLNQNQYDALCSFVWNVGPGSMSNSWTIGHLLRTKQYTAAANSMLDYDRAGGVVLEGLVRRREAERALFLTPPPPPPDPHHYSRFPILDEFDHKHWDERAIVQAYDVLRKHGVRNRRKLKPLRADLEKLADRLWSVAHEGVLKGHEPDWDLYWRGWRWQQLEHRAQGKTVND